jgi:UDP-N-acetylglucosamine:LPS N-acetylglucosamine transferase
VYLVASSGGHLAQLLCLAPWWQERRRTWVTFPLPDTRSALTGEDVVYAHHPTTRNLPNLARNLLLAWRTLRRDRPDVIVSTGAGVAVPYFVIGRLLQIPTVFVEVFDRIDSPTLTGRLCRPFTTRMCVQWDSQRELYGAATLVGPLL